MGFKARPLEGTVSSKLIVAGVLALDDLKTPKRSEKSIVGGAGVYSSVASSFFTNTTLIAAIGNDFPNYIAEKLEDKRINLDSVKTLDYPTFHWSGEYVGDMSQAITHETDFQINDHYNWEVSEKYRKTDYALLCNNDPLIQNKVLSQLKSKVIALDTMNLWIDIQKKKLDEAVSKIQLLFLNDGEARMYSQEEELDIAAEILLKKGPEYVIIKRGEKGATLYSKNTKEIIPCYTINNFVDPTGAGDTFAGAAMGYLAREGKYDYENLVKAMYYGSATASITVEGFGTEAIMNATFESVNKRFKKIIGGPGRI
tara:strand:+ start:2470 stop:3408 length:939 start_codon:yes stop_codon:yes gene_type:complete